MTLFFTAVDLEGEVRNFTCSCDNLAIAVEILSAISLLGDLFINVELIEHDKRTRLSAEDFNRMSFSTFDHQLNDEWQQELNKLGISAQ